MSEVCRLTIPPVHGQCRDCVDEICEDSQSSSGRQRSSKREKSRTKKISLRPFRFLYAKFCGMLALLPIAPDALFKHGTTLGT